MNKTDLIDVIAESAEISKTAATTGFEALVNAIISTLKKGDEVNIGGLGKFVVRQRKARSGRNPKTGETINIAASKVPAFKPGKPFKDAIQ